MRAQVWFAATDKITVPANWFRVERLKVEVAPPFGLVTAIPAKSEGTLRRFGGNSEKLREKLEKIGPKLLVPFLV